MFNLERSIEKYACQIHPKKDDVLGRRAELEDHMYMVIEALVEDGMTDKEAFDALVNRMGDPKDLASESKKNDAWYRKVHEYLGSIGYWQRQVFSFGVGLLFCIVFMPKTPGDIPVFFAILLVPALYLGWFDRERSILHDLYSMLSS